MSSSMRKTTPMVRRQRLKNKSVTLIRSRAKNSMMSMSPFGRAVERRGLDSLRKLQLSASRGRVGTPTSQQAQTPIASDQDEDLFLCARLGQLLLKRNQELTAHVDALKAALQEKDNRVEELEALDSSRHNTHIKLVDSHRLLQDETVSQHSRILQQDEEIAQLRKQLHNEQERNRNLELLRRQQAAAQDDFDITIDDEKENFDAHSPRRTSPAKLSLVHSPRRTDNDHRQYIMAMTMQVSPASTTMHTGCRSNKACVDDDGEIITADPGCEPCAAAAAASAWTATRAVPRIAAVSTQTRVVMHRSSGMQTDATRTFCVSCMQGQPPCAATAAAEAAAEDDGHNTTSLGPGQLPESQHELEMLLKVILQSLFHKKLEAQLDGASAEGGAMSLGEEGVMDPASCVGVGVGVDALVDGRELFNFNFLEDALADGKGDGDGDGNSDGSHPSIRATEGLEQPETVVPHEVAADPELHKWYSDVFATELHDLNMMRNVRRLSAASHGTTKTVGRNSCDGRSGCQVDSPFVADVDTSEHFFASDASDSDDGTSEGDHVSLSLVESDGGGGGSGGGGVGTSGVIGGNESNDLLYSVTVSNAGVVADGLASPGSAAAPAARNTQAGTSSAQQVTTTVGVRDAAGGAEEDGRATAHTPTGAATRGTAAALLSSAAGPPTPLQVVPMISTPHQRKGLFVRLASPLSELSARAISLMTGRRSNAPTTGLPYSQPSAPPTMPGSTTPRVVERGFTVVVTFLLTLFFSSLWRRRYSAVTLMWRIVGVARRIIQRFRG